MSFGAFVQIARLFGGQLGTTAIQVFTRQAEQTHSQLLGSHVSAFDTGTLDRRQAFCHEPHCEVAGKRSGRQRRHAAARPLVRAQTYTLACADGMAVCAGVAIAARLLVLSLRKPP